MKIYAGSSRKPFDFSTITKYVGKDVWVAIESRFFGSAEEYLMYIHFISVDEDTITYNGVDTPTLAGLESLCQDTDFYQILEQRFNREAPFTTTKKEFSRLFTKVHKPVEAYNTADLQQMLENCEVEE